MGQDNAELIAEAREWAFVNAVADRPEADVLRRLADALERVTPRVVAEPTIGIRNPDGSITFNGVFPADATSGVLTVSADTEPPRALFTPTGKETE